MVNNFASERLQPSLLDRLTDDQPGVRTETRAARVIDVNHLRDIVQRDLSWLLNTQSAETGDLLDDYPQVRVSVLNYGITPSSGDFSTAQKVDRIRASIITAIERYEPRLIRGSVVVSLRDTHTGGSDRHITFDVRADLWAQPMPLELYLRSRIDLTTGEISMDRSG